MRKNILLTNDDGVRSPGLAAAAQAMSATGNLQIIAPLHQQTAMGRAHAGNSEATLVPATVCAGDTNLPAFACDASPAAAVGHGLRVLHGYKPDLLVSGINYGENLGANITSSGTVGAAFEAAARGIPAIAISLETHIDSHYKYSEQDWSAAMHFLAYFAQVIIEKGLPQDVHVLKIDVPRNATKSTQWRLTRLASHSYYEARILNPSLKSRLCDAQVSKVCPEQACVGTDVHALGVEKIVSVTPLSLDFTSRTEFSSIASWLNEV